MGERNFNLDGKAFFYDLKNNLFGENTFCPDKGGVFKKSKTPVDFFAGKIYKMKDNLKEKI